MLSRTSRATRARRGPPTSPAGAPPADREIERSLILRVGRSAKVHQVEAVWLVDPGASAVLSVPGVLPKEGTSPLPEQLAELAASDAPELRGPLGTPQNGELHFLLSAPLVQDDGTRSGTLIYRIPALPILDLLLRDSSSIGSTLESLIVRREGSELVLVSPRAEKESAVGGLRLADTDPELPAAFAERGGVGATVGIDYRGHRVLAHVLPIPSTGWKLVTKVDRAEVEARLRASAWRVSGASLLFFCLGALGFVAWVGRREERASRLAHEYRGLFENVVDGILLTDRDGRLLEANEGLTRILGYEPGGLVGKRLAELVDPDDLRREPFHLVDVRDGGSRLFERRYRRRDGSTVETEVSASPVGDGRVLAVVRDLTGRRATEERLRVLSLALEESAAPTVVTDVEGTIQYVNPAFAEVTGWTAASAMGRTPAILKSERTPASAYREMWSTIRSGLRWEGTLLNRKRDGTLFWWQLRISPILDADGTIRHFVGVGEDITEQREREEGLRQTQHLAHTGSWSHALGTETLSWSDEAFRIFGRSPKAGDPRLEEVVRRYIHPEDRRRLVEVWDEESKLGSGRPFECRIVREDGEIRHVRWIGQLERDAAGRPLRFSGAVQDVTDQELARQQLEGVRAQLAQNQKMDALGRLAGGVAHDFNNLLGVVSGFAELLDGGLAVGAEERGHVREILRAVERGSELTRQLLAMSRKSVVRPRRLALGGLFEESSRMLRRLIPETIEIAWSVAPDLWEVVADTGQLVQVLMNLAINARDAMPEGGRLEIVAVNEVFGDFAAARQGSLSPGDYVRVEFIDDGVGMEEATAAQIFEPFFTTKGHGEGTGLGLATVYGILRQAGGAIEAASVPGEGTTMSFWLPRALGRDEPSVAPAPAEAGADVGAEPRPARRTGEILLVEDEAGVRAVVGRMLEAMGHRVTAVASASEALEKVRVVGPRFDLLLTDLVLPGLDGRRLAEELRLVIPGLPVVFMSGYSDLPSSEMDALTSDGALFLQKPFRSADLERVLTDRLR